MFCLPMFDGSRRVEIAHRRHAKVNVAIRLLRARLEDLEIREDRAKKEENWAVCYSYSFRSFDLHTTLTVLRRYKQELEDMYDIAC